MATANQSTPRCSSREDWWDVSRRSRDVEHSSFFTTITVILCWLLGTSVGKTGRVLRTDMPRSQHRFPPLGRLPPRSELATSSWKAHGRLVLAVHEEDSSRVTRCGHTWCPRRWETTSLAPGGQVESLGQPHKGSCLPSFPVPCPGPSRCWTALLGSACGVPTG